LSEKPQQPQPSEEEKKPKTVEEWIAKLAADQYENKKAIDLLAQAVVELNRKLTVGASGQPAQEQGGLGIIEQLAKIAGMGKKESSVEELAKSVEGLVRVADSLDRFRHPSRMSVGDALLMRMGMRAGYPRYMTKAEIERAEKMLGIWEALEGEGEEHVSE